jgi:hypothetical protein
VAGPVEWLAGGLGVVGSRDASPAAHEVARSAAQVAVDASPVIRWPGPWHRPGVDGRSARRRRSGGRSSCRGPEGRRTRPGGCGAGSQRRPCIASPYADDSIHRWHAEGRNKIIYGLADALVVVLRPTDPAARGRVRKKRCAAVSARSPSGQATARRQRRIGRSQRTAITDLHKVFDVTERPGEPKVQGSLF